MKGDEKYAQEMPDQKEQFDTLVKEITAQMKVAADKQLVAEMHTEAGKYIDNAQKYSERLANLKDVKRINELIFNTRPM
jgi:hypothetical protein